MNRKEFIENFDYTLFDDYIINNQLNINIPTVTTLSFYSKHYPNLLNIIYSNYNIKKQDFEIFSNATKGGVDYKCIPDKYYKNVLFFQFTRFYASLYSQYFINNILDYNEYLFLLYALLDRYRIYIKKYNSSLDYISKELLIYYFGYLTSHKYLKENIAYQYMFNIVEQLEEFVLYSDHDMIYFKNMDKNILKSKLHDLTNLPYEIEDVKFFYVKERKGYAKCLKINNTYQFMTRGIFKQDEKLEIEKEFLKLFRIEKIKIILI